MNRKIIKTTVLTLCLMFLLCNMTFAKSAVITDAAGEGSIFGNVSEIYYRFKSPGYFSLTVNAVYGFADSNKLNTFTRSCSNSGEGDDGRKTWNRRYAYILCDKNKKEIDPLGWHKPGKKNYRFHYYLKKGTYFIKIKTGEKKCGVYFIHGTYYPQEGRKAIARNSPGGKKKSKARTLKTPDGSSADTYYALRNAYDWNGNYFAFPYMGSGKNAQAWYKCYSDGTKPLYIVARVDSLIGRWDLVTYGPQYPKGISKTFPGSLAVTKKGTTQLYKDGKKVNRITVITLGRQNSATGDLVGPVPGWYYFKVAKHKVSGKGAAYYRKMSLLGDIYVSTNPEFKTLKLY